MKLKHRPIFRPIPIKLEVDPTHCMTTAFSGIMPYLDLWNSLGMPSEVDKAVSICGSQGLAGPSDDSKPCFAQPHRRRLCYGC